MSIADSMARIRQRIEVAAHAVGRNPEEIELMAATKTISAQRVREAYDAGIRLFGENRVQEFEGKSRELLKLSGARWHMIGHLQTNKAHVASKLFGEIESVDSLRLARKLDAAAAELGKSLSALIEINVGGEAAKSGLPPDSAELEELLQNAPSLLHLQFRGLMTVPPYFDDPELTRPYFRRIAELANEITRRKLSGITMDVLSMGMSHDFEIAIQEGATRVRIGTGIFGERMPIRGQI